MFHGLFLSLKSQPFILLFLVVAAGYALSRVRIKGIALGVVASTLIVGMLCSFWASQSYGTSLELPPILQTLFFNLYIFCVGLRVGPQCFAGLEKNGKQFLQIGLVSILLTPLVALACGWAFHLDAGTLAGILSGSNTASAAFGAAQSAITQTNTTGTGPSLAANLSVSFALGYALSLVGFVILLPFFPRLSRTDARKAALALERELSGGKAPLPQTEGALDTPFQGPIDIRVYRIRSPKLSGKTVASLIDLYPKVSIEQVRREGRLLSVTGALALHPGDEIAVGAEIPAQLRAVSAIGEEIDAPELRTLRPETADVVLTKADLVGKTLDDLRRGSGHGLYFSAAFRMGEEIPLQSHTRFKRHDVLRVTGSKIHVEALAENAGALIKNSISTDLLTVALGLLLGALLGTLVIPIGSIRLGVGTASGLLIVSILMSWLRTRYPTLGGPFPESARQFLEDLGLSLFIAIVGLNAGPGLVKALQTGTVTPILISTVLVGFVPPLISWFIGVRVLKMNPALLLGAIAGARQCSPAMKVAQDSVESSSPAIGFPVPFTLATLAYTFYGYLIIVLWSS